MYIVCSIETSEFVCLNYIIVKLSQSVCSSVVILLLSLVNLSAAIGHCIYICVEQRKQVERFHATPPSAQL